MGAAASGGTAQRAVHAALCSSWAVRCGIALERADSSTHDVDVGTRSPLGALAGVDEAAGHADRESAGSVR